MSILITDPDWIDKIYQVEGKAWLHMQELAQKRGDLSYTVFGAWDKWLSPDRDPEYFSYVIYGDGGVHRYFVRSDGHIAFSRRHSYPVGKNYREIAERVGFDIE